MSAEPAEAPRRRNWSSFDLFNGPLIRTWFRRWDLLIAANSSTRRQAKALFYDELAEAVRQGLPLEVALRANAQVLEEVRKPRKRAFPAGADTRYELPNLLLGFFYLITAPLSFLLYGLVSVKMGDEERICRLLARRLSEEVEKGVPLSDAMEKWRQDFDTTEVAAVRAGEQGGDLPNALKALAEGQNTSARLCLYGDKVVYPLVVFAVAALIYSWWMLRTINYFESIYSQLGAELPFFTQLVFFVCHRMGLPSLAFVVCPVLIVAVLLRVVMNGTVIGKLLTTGISSLIFGCVAAAVFSYILVYGGKRVGWDTDMAPGVGVLLALLATVLYLPWITRDIEGLVLRGERWMAALTARMPLIGRWRNLTGEVRWLGALHTCLRSGMELPQALRTAGSICGGKLRAASQAAAEKAERGVPLGAAAAKMEMLSRRTRAALAFHSTQPQLPDALRQLANDRAVEAHELSVRTARELDVICLVVVGLLIAVLMMALYIPLFEISSLIPVE